MALARGSIATPHDSRRLWAGLFNPPCLTYHERLNRESVIIPWEVSITQSIPTRLVISAFFPSCAIFQWHSGARKRLTRKGRELGQQEQPDHFDWGRAGKSQSAKCTAEYGEASEKQ
jgi:hypothetical protein